MSDERAEMWGYWRPKYGIKQALTEYFPETLKSEPRLQVALAQLQNAEAAIEAVFREKRAEESEEDID